MKQINEPLVGSLQLTARGGGFLILGDGRPDLRIPSELLCGAMDGDLVRAEQLPPVPGESRAFGGVTEILKRAHTLVVGTVNGEALVPDQRKLPELALRYNKGETRLSDGTKAVAAIDRYPDGARPMLGHIVEVLGQKGERGVDVKSVIRRCGIRDAFPPDALLAAQRTPDRVEPQQRKGRKDLRDKLVFTIDGRSSRDFDDAVSVERLDNGDLLLGVHIADVSAYVPEGGALDREARLRGTSVYFPFHEKRKVPKEKRSGSLGCRMPGEAAGQACAASFCEKTEVSKEKRSGSLGCRMPGEAADQACEASFHEKRKVPKEKRSDSPECRMPGEAADQACAASFCEKTEVQKQMRSDSPECRMPGEAEPADPLETGVIPMLPEKLSTGICSLNQGEDRLALSCLMRVDGGGRVVGSKLAETVIRSRYRLVYEDVTALLEGPGTSARNAQGSPYGEAEIAELAERYGEALPSLRLLEGLYRALAAARLARGGVDFDLPESQIAIDEDGRAVGLRPAERGVANRIIEECMLLANQTVARIMLAAQAPILYRVHEKPDGDRMTAFNTFLKSLGYPAVPHPEDPAPRDLAGALALAKGKQEEALIGKIALRSMQKARYGEKCLGHFGLALKEYCHFTSPIRRYPDLFTHRVAKLWLHGKLEKQRERLCLLAPKLAEETSAAERAAMEAERGVDDLKKCEYMASKIGHDYSGVVSGVAGFGLFVELPNTAEGLVRLSAFSDDYYECEPERYRVVGRRHGRVLRLGDSLRVIVNSVDLDGPTIDFLPKTDYHEKGFVYNPEKADRKRRSPGKQRRGRPAPIKGGKRHATRKGHQGAGPKPKGKA